MSALEIKLLANAINANDNIGNVNDDSNCSTMPHRDDHIDWNNSDNNNKNREEWLLSKEEIHTFLQDGVLVVDNVLNQSQLEGARDGLKHTLAYHGVDIDNLERTGAALRPLSSTNGSGGVLDLFYPGWKMDVATNPRLFQITCQLWRVAYSHNRHNDNDDEENHPYGPFDEERGFIYVDRIGYRLPTELAEQIGVDLLPTKPDALAAPGFHRNFHSWARTRPPAIFAKKGSGNQVVETCVPAPCVGDYTHIRPNEDRSVMDMIRHVPVKAGSAVFWDNRIPHANAYRNDDTEPRAVVYCSFLPDIELNRKYMREQLLNWKRRRRPTDFWMNLQPMDRANEERGTHRSSSSSRSRRSSTEPSAENDSYRFSSLGRQLVGLDPW